MNDDDNQMIVPDRSWRLALHSVLCCRCLDHPEGHPACENLLQPAVTREMKANLTITECFCSLSGCPVKLPRLNEIREKLDCLSAKEKQILCDSLFLTINWFREVCFAECECKPSLYFYYTPIYLVKMASSNHCFDNAVEFARRAAQLA